MINKLKETIKKFSMLENNSRVLLCVSGGPDSVAMLSAFYSIKDSMRLKLFVAHLNHMLRGKESNRDEEYVKRLAKRLDLDVVINREDVDEFARSNKLSLEDAARRLRYKFFLNAAHHFKANIIATAHTMDDQAETVLMRLLRGSGLKGLRGIAPVREVGSAPGHSVKIIRPLIEISRKEVEEYVNSKGIKPCFDKSNLSPALLRNRIRLELIPYLEKRYNPRIRKTLSDIAEILDRDYDYLNLCYDILFRNIAKVKESSVISLPLTVFKREHISVQRAFVRKSIEALKGDLEGIEFRHWNEIEELIYKRPYGSIVHLPGRLKVERLKTILEFSRRFSRLEGPLKKPDKSRYGLVILDIPGLTRFAGKVIRATILNGCNYEINHTNKTEYFDMSKIEFPIMARLRQQGDRIIPLGMKDYKRLKAIFIDEKIPLQRRDKIPLVVSSTGEILWVCGIRMSDKYKITSSTKKILKLEMLEV